MKKTWLGTKSLILTFSIIADSLTPLVLSSQPKLLSVNVSNNIIQDIQPGAFTNMSRLVRLILTKNKITKLDPLSLSGKVINPTARNSEGISELPEFCYKMSSIRV